MEAIYPRNATKILRKTHLFQDRLKNGKVRFDCAGAGGSRVEPSKKTNKSEEKRPANQHTHKTDFSVKSNTAPAQSPQTPLFKKLTLSHRNSNHSKECFPSSKNGLQGVLSCIPRSQVSLDRPHGRPGAKVEAPGLPNDRFGHQK